MDKASEAERPPKYERKPAGSGFDAYAAQVRTLLVQTPTMPASVLAERVGWTGSASLFRRKVRVAGIRDIRRGRLLLGAIASVKRNVRPLEPGGGVCSHERYSVINRTIWESSDPQNRWSPFTLVR